MCTLACNGLADLLDGGNLIPIVAITFGCLMGMVGIVAGVMGTIMRTRAREQTKRELAAYVAEGTLDPDKAVAIINAGRPKWEICDFEKNA